MPQGFVITEWTEDQGLLIFLSYPDSLMVDLDDMMRIFYAHITGAGEAGHVMVRLEKLKANVSSYFSGMESETPMMINLLLDLGEDPEMFGENVIADIDKEIMSRLRDIINDPTRTNQLKLELSEFLKNSIVLLERLEHLSKEQRMAQIFIGEKAKAILELLRERPYSRRDLQYQLEEKIDRLITNLEITLDPFIKTDLVRQDWIPGDQDISIFLVKDFTIMRSPPKKIVDAAKKGLPSPGCSQKYLEKVKQFFSEYEPSLKDQMNIAGLMVNPDIFDYIVLFREKSYPINKVPKGPGESFEDVQNFINDLVDQKVLTVIEDSGTKWVMLLSDISAETFYPEYLIENIRRNVEMKKIKRDTAVKHLEILEQAYKK